MSFPTEQQVEAVAEAIYKHDGFFEAPWSNLTNAQKEHWKDFARAALTALAPDWREMERDALRYRWLRDSAWDEALCCAMYECTGDDMDAPIDAARERERDAKRYRLLRAAPRGIEVQVLADDGETWYAAKGAELDAAIDEAREE